MLTPKVRKDGRCVVCRGQRPFNPQRGVPFEAYWADPFCSSVCAKKHFGTTESTLRQTTHGILKSKEPPEDGSRYRLATSPKGGVGFPRQ